MSGGRLAAAAAAALLLTLLTPGHPRAGDQIRTLRELGYGDATAHNMHAELDYFLPIPAGQVAVAPSELELVISHSPLLAGDRSTLTVTVDGRGPGTPPTRIWRPESSSRRPSAGGGSLWRRSRGC